MEMCHCDKEDCQACAEQDYHAKRMYRIAAARAARDNRAADLKRKQVRYRWDPLPTIEEDRITQVIPKHHWRFSKPGIPIQDWYVAQRKPAAAFEDVPMEPFDPTKSQLYLDIHGPGSINAEIDLAKERNRREAQRLLTESIQQQYLAEYIPELSKSPKKKVIKSRKIRNPSPVPAERFGKRRPPRS